MEFLGMAFDLNDAFIIAAFIAAFMGLFDHVWKLILDIWDWLIPFEVLDEYEGGVVLRWGKWNRTIGPGLRWHWPFGIEEILSTVVVRRVAYGDVQSCDSKDGVSINISPIIVFHVGNVKRWLLEVDDAEDALLDITYGIVEENVNCTEARWIKDDEFKADILAEVKDEGKTWGARVQEIKFSDRSKSKALRLWTGSGHMELEDEE